MRSREEMAAELLRCALSWEPMVNLVGNVRAYEVALVAAGALTSCPACGAEPFVNIDCDVCLCVSHLQNGELP